MGNLDGDFFNISISLRNFIIKFMRNDDVDDLINFHLTCIQAINKYSHLNSLNEDFLR